MNITKEQAEELIKNSVSKSELCRKLNISANGHGLKIVGNLIEKYNLDTSHFSHRASIHKFQKKYKDIEKVCPICNAKFWTKEGHKREKVTCSHSCSNSYFRTGINNPNYKIDQSEWGYRKICFSKWKKECIICGFDKVVDVHHLDHNNRNNDINNLIPLCPNHHKLIHTNEWGEQTVNEIKEKLRDVG